ncbi:hypothetical protein DY000_02020752 [Brassica cretica]|uniref:Uncharacterized protein n=1 Tax=Brassica cretica TaxID=69181 RepID=A0ABQ7EJ07_BRACR|nr:hypothetical protein DY000_02020752 [Brassica cretica]
MLDMSLDSTDTELNVYWKAKETDGNGYPRRLLSSSGTVTRVVTEQLLDGTGSGALSMASVLSVLDGWLETKPSLFVYLGHVGMVG